MILMVVGAAWLYLLVLPLFGMLAGIVVRVLVPYGVGAFLIYALVTFVWSQAVWYSVVAMVAWGAAIFMSRQQLKKLQGGLQWHEGHYLVL